MKDLISGFARRIAVFADKSAFLLIGPFSGVLYLVDGAMLVTLVEWLIFAPILAGVGIIVSRLIFPHVPLTVLVKEALQGNLAAGVVAGALIVFVGFLLISLVLWTNA